MVNNMDNKIIKNEKEVPAFLTGCLTIILIVAFTFSLKNYEPIRNIIISGGIITYPFTFLIVALISKYYGFKSARKSIYISSLLYIIFMVLIMISAIPQANSMTGIYNSVIQYLFVNNYFTIGSISIFYPTLGHFFGVLIAFVVSHLLFATIYNAIHRFTVDYLAVGLGLFISYIIDRLAFIPILYAKGLSQGSNTFEYLIQCLTSEFIASIVASIIVLIIYIVITKLKKTVKN